METLASTFEDPSPSDLGQTDESTLRAICSRLRAIGSTWAAKIIEIDAGLGRFDPDPDDAHAQRIASLRDYCDLLEQHPVLAGSMIFDNAIWHSVNIYSNNEACLKKMREIRRAYGGTFTKEWDEGEHYSPEFRMMGSFKSMKVKIYTSRNNVCEKVVVGHETMTVKIKDPDLVEAATAEIPEVEREITTPITSWICPEDLA